MLKGALSIAIRYSSQRQQFGPPDAPEVAVLDYPSQQASRALCFRHSGWEGHANETDGVPLFCIQAKGAVARVLVNDGARLPQAPAGQRGLSCTANPAHAPCR